MKKTNRIFLIIIVTEVILSIIFLLWMFLPINTTGWCGSPCDKTSFLHPFDFLKSKETVCILICVYKPYPLFYITVDLLVMTLVVYIIYRMMAKKNKD